LLVYPDASGAWRNVDRWPDTPAKQRAFDVFSDLARLDARTVGADMPAGELPYLRFTPEAQGVFDTWRGRLERMLRADDEHPVLVSHLAKYRSLMPSLALLLHLADGGGGLVPLAVAEAAVQWCEYLEAHARRAYHPVTAKRRTTAALLGAKVQAGRLGNPFVARDVTQAEWAGLTEVAEVREALDLLVEHHWLRAVMDGRAAAGGRPTTRYHISPRLLCHDPSKPSEPSRGGVSRVLKGRGRGVPDFSGRVDGGPADLDEADDEAVTL